MCVSKGCIYSYLAVFKKPNPNSRIDFYSIDLISLQALFNRPTLIRPQTFQFLGIRRALALLQHTLEVGQQQAFVFNNLVDVHVVVLVSVGRLVSGTSQDHHQHTQEA